MGWSCAEVKSRLTLSTPFQSALVRTAHDSAESTLQHWQWQICQALILPTATTSVSGSVFHEAGNSGTSFQPHVIAERPEPFWTSCKAWWQVTSRLSLAYTIQLNRIQYSLGPKTDRARRNVFNVCTLVTLSFSAGSLLLPVIEFVTQAQFFYEFRYTLYTRRSAYRVLQGSWFGSNFSSPIP